MISNGSLTNSSNTSTNEVASTLKMTPEELRGFMMVPEPHTLPVITSEVMITISCTQYSLLPPSLPSPDMKNTLITARVKFSDQHGARSRGAQARVGLGGEQAEVRPGPLSQQHGIAAPHDDIDRADALVPTKPGLVFPTRTTRPLLHLLVISEDLATTQKMQQNKNSRNRQHKRAGEPSVPNRLAPTLDTTGLAVPLNGNPTHTLILAAIPAVLGSILIFMNKQDRAAIVVICSTVGLSTPILSKIPMLVLYEVFLYMDVASLNSLQFFDRILPVLITVHRNFEVKKTLGPE